MVTWYRLGRNRKHSNGIVGFNIDNGFASTLHLARGHVLFRAKLRKYKGGSNWGSFIGITLNNLYVGMLCFVLGVFGGLGTGYVLLKNGIMFAVNWK